MLNNIPKSDIELWRQFESSVIQEKNSVEALMSMLSGLNNKSGLSYTMKPSRDPYEHSNENEEAPRRTSNNFRTTNRGFSVNKSSTKPFKDPEVWDPPPPRPGYQGQPVKRVSKNISQSQPYNAKGKPGSKKGVDPNGKKTFLQERYPDGNGPDTNLIEMLER